MTLWEKINFFAANSTPFLVIVDFLGTKGEVIPLEMLGNDICFSMDKTKPQESSHIQILSKKPISFKKYKEKFDLVTTNIQDGNTYLLNLTQSTQITTNGSLKEIYKSAYAKFKLLYLDQFVCFSPERFIQIQDNTIATFPMKGTIDASVDNAKEKILSNEKEMAEHTMVVDLLRNDLSIVAKNVRVDSFRYVETIQAGSKKLLQVSSKISGTLDHKWHKNLGDILRKLLPAGSISGTPKAKTVELIQEIEGYERGYFTGIFGVFDGKSFDSAVMIRFIENQNGTLVYKSGGGITIESQAQDEYHELLQKVYIPTC